MKIIHSHQDVQNDSKTVPQSSDSEVQRFLITIKFSKKLVWEASKSGFISQKDEARNFTYNAFD
jgi:hypothetical protein